MHHSRGIRLVAIGIPAILQIARSIVMRDARDLLIVPHDPHTLHAHDHVRQDVAVDHPHTGIFDTQAPASPPSQSPGGSLVLITI